MNRQQLKLCKMVNFMKDLADLATCKRVKRAAIVFAPDFSEIIAIGYNGPAIGQPNDACRDVVGACGCVHAETNAAIKTRTAGGVMLCSTSPCEMCASVIVNTRRIAGLIYNDRYRESERGLNVLLNGHVPAIELASLDSTEQLGGFIRWVTSPRSS